MAEEAERAGRTLLPGSPALGSGVHYRTLCFFGH